MKMNFFTLLMAMSFMASLSEGYASPSQGSFTQEQIAQQQQQMGAQKNPMYKKD